MIYNQRSWYCKAAKRASIGKLIEWIISIYPCIYLINAKQNTTRVNPMFLFPSIKKNSKKIFRPFFLAWCTPKTSRTDYFGWKMPGLTGSGSQHLWNSNWKQNLLFDGGFPTTYGRLGQSFAKCCSKKCTQTIAQSWRWSGTYLTSKYTYLPYLILVGGTGGTTKKTQHFGSLYFVK